MNGYKIDLMKAKINISLFWKLLILCGALIFIAAITQHVLLKFLMSSDAMRKLYLQEWQQTIMQDQFRQGFQTLGNTALTINDAKLIKSAFKDYVVSEGYLIHYDHQPYLLLNIDNLAVVDLNGDVISQLGNNIYKEGNLFTQVSLDAREDLVEALIGKDPFGSSTSHHYSGVTVAISLKNTAGEIVGALMIKQRRKLSENASGLMFGFVQVIKGVAGFVASLLFACIFFALVMATYLNRRIKKITSAVQAWQQGDFTLRIIDNATDELAFCSIELNNMADSLEQAINQEAQIAAGKERQQLAISLHDTVKQRLFATNLKVALCERVLLDKPDNALVLLQEITEQCHYAFNELQQTIETLSTTNLKLWSDLPEFITNWQQQHSIIIHLTSPENWQPNQKVVSLFWRAIAEALQNIVKHAQASEVILSVSLRENSVDIFVQDNGIGCGEKPTLGQGLTLLKASFYEVGGTLQLTSAPSKIKHSKAMHNKVIHSNINTPTHYSSGSKLQLSLPLS